MTKLVHEGVLNDCLDWIQRFSSKKINLHFRCNEKIKNIIICFSQAHLFICHVQYICNTKKSNLNVIIDMAEEYCKLNNSIEN